MNVSKRREVSTKAFLYIVASTVALSVRAAGGTFLSSALRHFSLPFVDVANRVEFLFDNAEPVMKMELSNENTEGQGLL